MATKQSSLLSNRATQTLAGVPRNVVNDGGRLHTKNGTVALAVADLDANDIVMLFGVPTGAAILELWIANDDLEGATPISTFNLGIYKKADDTAENGDENVYATLVTQLQAASAFVDLAFEARGIELAGQQVFKDAGDTVDPDSEYFVGLQIVTSMTNKVAGDVSFKCVYAVD